MEVREQHGDVLAYQLGENFLLYGTTKDIWDAAKETYSSFDNSTELFAVESIIHDLRQGDLTVTQYCNITRNWLQLDMFEEYDWNCSEDGIKHRKIIEKKRLYKFLLEASTRTLMKFEEESWG